MTLRVVRPGLHTLVVDFGRPHWRCLGVPVGGAADRAALALGNALVGNAPDAPGLEFSLTGPTVVANCNLACVVYGSPFPLASEKRDLTVGVTFTLSRGQDLEIGCTEEGMRGYLCVRGGLQAPPILDSRSSLEPIQAGAEFICAAGTIGRRFVSPHLSGADAPRTLRVLDGAQVDWIEPQSVEGREFTVSPASNRMGLRLRGEPFRLPARELLSEPVCPGTVQVTRDGQCIILGMDGQTIGGYPKVAQVISADLDKLAQLRPGDPIRFRRIGLEEAQSLYHTRQAEIREWVTRLRTTS